LKVHVIPKQILFKTQKEKMGLKRQFGGCINHLVLLKRITRREKCRMGCW